MTAEREAFESEARWHGLHCNRNAEGDYAHIGTQCAWIGWQAAAARYEGVVEAATRIKPHIDAFDGVVPEGSAFEVSVPVGLLRDLRQALAALDGAHE